MIFFPVLFNVFTSLLLGGQTFFQKPDPCEEAKTGAIHATLFAKDSLYKVALTNIKNAFRSDMKEHCVAFGKDTTDNIIASGISNGSTKGGKVPAITNAFADLHNHPNNVPPDAGDLYGLIDINKNNHDYKTRFVVTPDGTLYALLVTDTAAAFAFTKKHPRQPPAFNGGPPGFPVAIVDESREMKYQYHCTDEMVMAFILEKYHAGVSLLKQDSKGIFNKITTIVLTEGNHIAFSVRICP